MYCMNLTPRTIQESSGLRAPIIEAARKVLLKEGYERLSMRRVAEEAGCSTMALYRHFANKEALTQFLCTELYTTFTERINSEMATVNGPREQLRVFIAALIDFAASYPDHYSIIFLIRFIIYRWLLLIRAVVQVLVPCFRIRRRLRLHHYGKRDFGAYGPGGARHQDVQS